MTDRTPLLTLCGFLGNDTDWEAVTNHMLNLGRGWETSMGVGYTLEERAEHILSRTDPATFDVAGYSMGGRITYGLLAKAPHRIRRFVTLGARAARADEARAARDEAWATMLETDGLEAFLDAWYAQPLFAAFRKSPRFHAIRDHRLMRHKAKWVAETLRAMSPAKQPDFTEMLHTTDHPGLLIAGELDPFYVEQNAALAAANPNLRAEVIPGAGHALLAEAPEAVGQLLDDFLA